MGKLDVAIVILVVLGGLSCFRAGFTRSVWGLAAISAGVFVASELWLDLASFLGRFIKNSEIAKWVSVIAIVVGVSAVVDVIFERLQRILRRGVSRWVDNVVGAVFGVVSSGILIGLTLVLLNRYGGDALREAIASSHLAPRLLEIGTQVFDFGKKVVKEHAGKV